MPDLTNYMVSLGFISFLVLRHFGMPIIDATLHVACRRAIRILTRVAILLLCRFLSSAYTTVTDHLRYTSATYL